MEQTMMSLQLLLDIMLAVMMIWLAIRMFSEASLFKSVVLFIAFGLFVALAWVKMSAPDIALTEAALGAGITGALMLDTVGHLRRRQVPYSQTSNPGKGE